MSAQVEKKKVIYVHNGATTFVRKDQRLIAEAYRIEEFAFVAKSKWDLPFLFLRQILFCVRQLPSTSIIVCQFAGHHSLMPLLLGRLFGKPGMILSNGSDCVSFPSLGYGHFRKPLMAATTRWSFKLAKLIVPLHSSLIQATPTYHNIDGPAQGILHFCPGLRTPMEPLGYGFDSEFWKASGVRDPKRFVTVASNAHKPYIQVIKGLDMILQVAPHFPDHEFVIIGAREGSFKNKPANVVEVPFIPNEELPAYYGQASFYLQLSVSEGFGNALCEAMLCGCIPIVSEVGAMPEIVGDSGVVVERRTVDDIAAGIAQALGLDQELFGTKARNRIFAERPECVRSDGLMAFLERVIRNSNATKRGPDAS